MYFVPKPLTKSKFQRSSTRHWELRKLNKIPNFNSEAISSSLRHLSMSTIAWRRFDYLVLQRPTRPAIFIQPNSLTSCETRPPISIQLQLQITKLIKGGNHPILRPPIAPWQQILIPIQKQTYLQTRSYGKQPHIKCQSPELATR